MEQKLDVINEENKIKIPRLNEKINGKIIFNSINHTPSSSPQKMSNNEMKKAVKKASSIDKKMNKKRLAVAVYENKRKNLSKEYVFNFLAKNPAARTFSEIKNVAEYLSQNYQYFTKLKNEDSQLKVEKLTKICKVEKYFKGESIITFGEIGDKFYIVLEGMVEIYKPKFVEINETPGDFLNLLIRIKEMDGNDLRYKRIKNKNYDFFVNFPDIDINTLIREFEQIKYKQIFFMEEDEKKGEYGEGFAFGDIALIKKSARNATIKAKDQCLLLTIGKDDYTKAILEFQKRKLSKEIDIFVKTYSFFQYFNNDKVIQLFNCLTKIELYKGEYLYKQNMDADSIYILSSGSFSVYSMISFSWINDYINYMDYSDKNILHYIIKNKNINIRDLLKIIQNFQINNENSVKHIENNFLWEKLNERQLNDNLLKLKKDEEKLNSPDNIFKINLKKINYCDILGLEEVFEFKKRFCSCKCISKKAELKAIKITDLIKLIYNSNEEEINYLLHIINERKQILKSQLLNGIKTLDKEIIINFDKRYENLIKSSKAEEEEEKSNMLLTALRIKGYKTSIQDILDNKISLFPKEKNTNSYILKKIRRKNKSSEQLFNDYIKEKGTNNQFRFNKITNSFINENQKNNKKIVLNGIINKIQNKTPNNRNLLENRRYSILYNNLNKSTTNKSNPFRSLQNRYHLGLNKKNSFIRNNSKNRIIINKERQNLFSSENKKQELNNFNYYKRNSNGLIKSKSLPQFVDKTQTKKRTYRDTITNFYKINMPHFPLTKKNSELNYKLEEKDEKSNKDFLKEENSYKTFYNIFNQDKNFFLGAEFQKKLKKEYKLLDSIYDDNIIKKKIKIKNDHFL